MAVLSSFDDDKNLEVEFFEKYADMKRMKISKGCDYVKFAAKVGKKKSPEKLLKQFANFATKM